MGKRVRVPGVGEWYHILQRDPCSYCNGRGGTVDHVRPLAIGHDDGMANWAGACEGCNGRKADQGVLWFLTGLRRTLPRPQSAKRRRAARMADKAYWFELQAEARNRWSFAEDRRERDVLRWHLSEVIKRPGDRP